MGRRRTESFHFDPLNDEGSGNKNAYDDQKPKSTANNEFSNFTMKVENNVDSSNSSTYSMSMNWSAKDNNQTGTIQSKRKRINSNDMGKKMMFSPIVKSESKARPIKRMNLENFSETLKKGGGYKMSMKPQTESNEEDKNQTTTSDSDDDYLGCFNKNKRNIKRRRSRQKSTINNETNIPNKDLSTITNTRIQKIKYSIHSITEEESRSSSSTTSVKSSDDLTYLFAKPTKSHKSPRRKRSSFYTKSLKLSAPTNTDSNYSDSSKQIPSMNKVKKYTEGNINPLNEYQDKSLKGIRKRRMNSMCLSLNKL